MCSGKHSTQWLPADMKIGCCVSSRRVSVSPKKPSCTLTVGQNRKNVSLHASLTSLLMAFLLRHKWPALAFETSVQPDFWWQGPRRLACLPACTSLFWTAGPNILHLMERHVAAILKGDPLLRLWCPPVPTKHSSSSLWSVFSILGEFFFSVFKRDFWSEADKEQIYVIQTSVLFSDCNGTLQ